METRTLGRTNRQVSVVGLGCWQLGADWGDVSETDALAVVHAAVDAGVTFFDTADVYGDGRSEQLIGRFLKDRNQAPTVATKMGRRADPHVAEAYTLEAFRGWVYRSRSNLGVDTIDLVQLHCPPTSVFGDDRVFDALDTLVAEGRVAAYGVSVETCDDALRATMRTGVATVQIILNVFRRKPPPARSRALPRRARCRTARVAVDRRPARCLDGDTWGARRRASTGERRGCRVGAAQQRPARSLTRDLRARRPGTRARPLVSEPGR